MKREQHQKEAAEKLSKLVIEEDDQELVQLEEKYKGKCFYDDDENFKENRIIEDIEWDETQQIYHGVTIKVHDDGTPFDTRKCRESYMLSADKLAEQDRMIALFNTRKLDKARKRKEREDRQQKTKNKRRK